MLWKPAVKSTVSNSPLTRSYAEDDSRVPQTPASLKSPGLYKVQGVTVEGIMGGIFHQFVSNFLTCFGFLAIIILYSDVS